MLLPGAVLQINNTKTNIIDFSQSDNYAENTKISSQADDILEGSIMNYTGRDDLIRNSNVGNVTHIIKEEENTSKSAVVPKHKSILRTQKTNKMPSQSNLYLRRFRECIQLGKRCRWS